jgi:Xaa-Pro dipeptidase
MKLPRIRHEGVIPMNDKLTKAMLEERIHKLLSALQAADDSYDTVILTRKVNQYYYTGTMQDGLLVFRRDGQVFYFVRKSAERARMESPLAVIVPIRSYADIRAYLPEDLGSVYLETESMPLAMIERIRKYFRIDRITPVDRIVALERSVKTKYELEFIRESGRLHQKALAERVPTLLREGINEADFTARLYSDLVQMGHHGVSRFSMYQVEMIVGQLGFGVTSMYPTYFDGPGGMQGLCPAVPLLGRRDVCLRKGDIVFVDVGFGYMGYQTDKTQVYSFQAEPSEIVTRTHAACIEVMNKASKAMRPGHQCQDVYHKAMMDLPKVLETSDYFMGYKEERVKFLGHGVGLEIDELPVIADKVAIPICENMVIALEPKCGVEGVGMVGVEETFVIGPDGAECITGGPSPILTVN